MRMIGEEGIMMEETMEETMKKGEMMKMKSGRMKNEEERRMEEETISLPLPVKPSLQVNKSKRSPHCECKAIDVNVQCEDSVV